MHNYYSATTYVRRSDKEPSGAKRSDQEHTSSIRSDGDKNERSITGDLEAAAPSKKDQEHKAATKRIKHRPESMASKIERSITEDLEWAAPTRSDQEQKNNQGHT